MPQITFSASFFATNVENDCDCVIAELLCDQFKEREKILFAYCVQCYILPLKRFIEFIPFASFQES